MSSSHAVVAALDGAGYRLTGPRRAIAELITRRSGHFTAADLLDESRRRRLGIGRATIFRTLDVLSELNVLERLELPNGDHAYVACEPIHHHHLICSGCGRATDVEDRGVRVILRDIARRTGYRIESHRLELFGVCPACQGADRLAPTRPGTSR